MDKTNITVVTGRSFRIAFVAQDEAGAPRPLAGYVARMQIREDAAADAVLWDSEGSDPAALVVEPGGATGEVHLVLGARATSTFAFEGGVYDIELTNGSDPDDVFAIAEGAVTVLPGVTRA